MQIEVSLSRDELVGLVEQLAPLKIVLGNQGGRERSLTLGAPRDVSLVADAGLRFHCKAVVSWPVMGFDLPVSLNALTVLLRPLIAAREGRDVLAFQIEIEHADLVGVPTFFDEKVTGLVNRELRERRVELAWDYAQTLTQSVKMPESLVPVEHFDLVVTEGGVHITEHTLRLAVGFRGSVRRGDFDVFG